MRIVLIGQAPFGAKTFEALLDAGENVVAVYAPPDVPGAKSDPLKEAALKAQTPVFQPGKYTADHVFREFADLRPDLVILAFVTTIIPLRYFEAAVHGAICFHPSLLPRHRGASAINWAIIMGEARTGLSIFWPDAGIDTGPVLLQKSVEIGPEDTAGSLYFDRLFPMGVDAVVESVKLIKAGKAPKLMQEEKGATYEPHMRRQGCRGGLGCGRPRNLQSRSRLRSSARGLCGVRRREGPLLSGEVHSGCNRCGSGDGDRVG